MPITFTVENVDSISIDQVKEIQTFISERSGSLVRVLVDIPNNEKYRIDGIQISPYVNIEGNDQPKLKLVPHYKTLENKGRK